MLAGEWVAQGHGDDYLLFKPDAMEPKSGRFGGIESYDRYEIENLILFGRHYRVKLASAAIDFSEPPLTVTADVSPDGRTLKLRIPASKGRKSPPDRFYRKATR